MKLLVLLITPLFLWANLSAETLGEDSIQFARYWELIETGDRQNAAEFLKNMGSEKGDHLEKMSNFFQAWLVLESGDLQNVSIYIDLGIPDELYDHGKWMRSSALKRAGQVTLAASYWGTIARDSNSVYQAEAIEELALLAKSRGDMDSLIALVSLYDKLDVPIESRQRLDFMVATVFSELGNHKEAVERLWSIYLTSPKTADGQSALNSLKGYPSAFGFRPRDETQAETELELFKLSESSNFSYGLSRVEQKLSANPKFDVRDMLTFYKGRFENGLRKHKLAIETLKEHTKNYPLSPYRSKALFYLSKSAYLTDNDALATQCFKELLKFETDSAVKCLTHELMGIMLADRGKFREAVSAYEAWKNCVTTSDLEDDCLWRLGWVCWEDENFSKAIVNWQELFEYDQSSDYAPAALYWMSRAYLKLNLIFQADSISAELAEKFPGSYYKIKTGDSVRTQKDTVTQNIWQDYSLNKLWNSGKVHSQKFALLAAMRLTEYALKEWPLAFKEQNGPLEFIWWKAQCQLWNQEKVRAYLTVLSKLRYFIISKAENAPQDFWSLVYPLDYDPLIIKFSKQQGIDPYFAMGVICQESHYNERAYSPVGAMGLMQLMPATARMQAKKMGIAYSTDRLYDPEFNLELGIAHLKELLDEFNGDTVLVLCAYNAGKSAAQAWYEEFGHYSKDAFIEKIPYRETRLFVKRILEHISAYRKRYPDLLLDIPASETNTP